jgi:hypothetical protein
MHSSGQDLARIDKCYNSPVGGTVDCNCRCNLRRTECIHNGKHYLPDTRQVHLFQLRTWQLKESRHQTTEETL